MVAAHFRPSGYSSEAQWSGHRRPAACCPLAVGLREDGRFTGSTEVAFSHGRGKERQRRTTGKQTSTLFQLTLNPLCSSRANSISQWASRKRPRSITSLTLFIKATGCELTRPWRLNHGTSPKGPPSGVQRLLPHLDCRNETDRRSRRNHGRVERL